MKGTFTLTIVLTLILTANLTGQNNYYYHSPTGKEALELSTQKFLIKFVENTDFEAQQSILDAYKDIALLRPGMQLPAPKAVVAEFENELSETQIWDIIHSLNQDVQVIYANPIFIHADGTLQAVQESIIVRLKTANDYTLLKSTAATYQLDIIQQNKFDANIYHLATRKNAAENALIVANELYETGIFEFIEPDFLRFMKKMMTNDPALGSQWSIDNTGQYNGTPGADMNIFDAWMHQTGNANIKVAILDEGVDINHPDLLANLENGYDATGQGSAGAPSGNDAHGTACAGIVAAVGNNGLGMAGVAYGSKIIPVRIAYSDGEAWVTSNAWIGNAINWSWQNAGADVLSNSWGGGGSSFTIDAAINNAVANGRDGLGSPVLFAAGNDNAGVSYPATNENTIAVAAMSMCHERKNPASCDGETWWGSNFGTDVDIAAPGVKIYATDISGSAGYSSGDFVTGFNGTSSATPNAAGVMALILSANGSLTEEQARFALESTCEKVGNYTYTVGTSGQPNGSWSNELGYGKINALAAITAVAPSRVDDAGIMLINSPNDEAICANQVSPVITLRNNGANNLTSVDINYQIDNNQIHVYPWTGNLSTTQNIAISLPSIPVNDGVHILNVFTSHPNSQADTNTSNDHAAATFSSGSNQITLQITLDNYGTETSWQVQDANGNTLQEGGPYQDNAVGTEIKEDICLPAGCFDFIIYDAYGDGMCCGYGNGSYRLVDDANGNTLASGGQYGSQELTNFCLTNTINTTPLTVNITNTSPVSCHGFQDGAAMGAAQGGTEPYTFEWSNGTNGAIANGLSAGTYTLKVIDTEGQIATISVTINEPTALDLTMIQSEANNGNNGYAAVEVAGGTSPYAYSWSNGASTPGISGLSGGTYTVTVTDANECFKLGSVVVEEVNTPALTVNITSHTNVSCNGGQNGSATAVVSGGVAPYSFQWNNGQVSSTASGLAAGYAVVAVVDSEGSQASAQVTITEPTALSLTMSATNAENGDNGTAYVNVTGGTGAYTYNWSNGASTPTISGLSGGTYTVTVTDANECFKLASVVVEEINTPALTVNITSHTNVSCNSGQNGSATAVASGGLAPYSFQWNNGQVSNTASGLAAGYAVVDSEGSQASAQVTITEPTALSLTMSATNAENGDNGTATVYATGGTGAYNYNWSNGASTPNISNLSGGTYTVTVTDANECFEVSSVLVEEINTPTLTVNITSHTNVSCNGGQNGSATAIASGGVAPYSFQWNNGQVSSTASGLSAGYAVVAVVDSEGSQASAQVTITEPISLSLAMSITDANGGDNGAVTVNVGGGTSPYTYSWSNGTTTANLDNLAAGTYYLTVTDDNNCLEIASVNIDDVTPEEEDNGLVFEQGLLSDIGENWETISLENTYTSMVVIASVRLPNANSQPVVTRVRHAEGNSFDIKTQVPGGTTNDVFEIDYMVIEEGVYNMEEHGVKMEAIKANAAKTARAGSWTREERTYQNTYESPVVLGQVMTANNEAWSVFWASSSTSRSTPPKATSFAAGKNVAEDTNRDRADETIGYLVIEAGLGTINGLNFQAGLGADIVMGLPNSDGEGYAYEVEGLVGATSAIVSTAAIDGNNGGWPALLNEQAVNHRRINLTFDEDQIKDEERSHTTEQAAFIVFEDVEAQPEPLAPIVFEEGIIENIGTQWTNIELSNDYTSMVVVATVVQTSSNDTPVVTRIQNANGNSFQLKVQSTTTSNFINTTYSIHYMVIEEGVYTELEHGVNMEAVKVNSTQTSARNIWKYEYQTYQNNYNTPVVLGQVMTHHDSDWSVFWSSNGFRKNPATATSLAVGKHVGEDPDKSRNDETLGYIVIEQGVGYINGMEFIAGVGADIVLGVGGANGTDTRYDVEGASVGSTAVLSASGIDGADCGWPILYGETPVQDGQLALAFDEDQMNDSERAHTTEQVAFIVFNTFNANANFMAQTPQQAGYNDTPTTYFAAYPNPTTDVIHIEHEFTASGAAQIIISDILGRTLVQENIFIEKEAIQHFQLDVRHLEVGQYVITILSDDGATAEQFIKSN